MTQDLIKGAKRFKADHYGEDGVMPTLAVKGQDPKYFMISCIDSRANPATVLNAAPGSFFAHKAMGAIVRPYKKGTALAAALHFALNYNNVEKIIIMGHTKCGAVKALAEELQDEEIQSFIEVAKHALSRAKTCCDNHDQLLKKTEEEVVIESTNNLKQYPSVAKALEENRIEIESWIYDITSGNILEQNPSTRKFEEVNNA